MRWWVAVWVCGAMLAAGAFATAGGTFATSSGAFATASGAAPAPAANASAPTELNAVPAASAAAGSACGPQTVPTLHPPAPADAAARTAARAPGPEKPIYIVVDVEKRQLTVFAQGRPYKTYPVGVGMGGYKSTPVGEWTIISKSYDWGGGFGTRWIGLNVPWGIYGLHGTNKPWSIGRRESAGCVRMLNRDVEELFEWVERGMKVIITGVFEKADVHAPLRSGHSGKDVVLLQQRLRGHGIDPGNLDGRFGPDTARAVQELQAFYGLPRTGVVDDNLLYLLGLK